MSFVILEDISGNTFCRRITSGADKKAGDRKNGGSTSVVIDSVSDEQVSCDMLRVIYL